MNRELTNLSPAEVLLIENQAVKVDALARVTFFDLVLKKVLEIEIDPKATENEKKNPTVRLGKSFTNYQSLKHESIFLSLFEKENELKINLSNLLKTAFEGIKNSTEYKFKYVYSEERMEEYFKSNFFLNLFGVKKMSRKGKDVQKEIKRHLKRIRTSTTKKEKDIVETLLALNGNILLIPKIPTEIFELIEKKKSGTRKNDSGDYAWADYGYSALYFHDGTKNQFDLIDINDADFMPIIDSVDGFSDSSGDSSFGGDGGCSGCGGCGGCGGS